MPKKEDKILKLLAKDFINKRAFDRASMAKILFELSLSIEGANKILDLGCGSGRLLIPLAKLYPTKQFVGLDISRGMLQSLAEVIKLHGLNNVQIVKDDFENGWANDFKGQKFDTIIFFQNIHFVQNIEKFIKGLSPLLTENGRVVLASTSHNQFFRLPYCRASEKVLKTELSRTPDEPRIIEEFVRLKYRLISRVEICAKRKFAGKQEMERWLRSRPFSVLAYLNDEELENWLAKFVKSEGNETDILVDEMVLLTFGRKV